MKVMESKTSLLKYGILIAASLTAYFLILNSIGLSEKIELRLFNFLIIMAGIIMAIRSVKANEPSFDYLRGFGVGLYVTIIATIPFAVFMFFFLELNEPFMLNLIENAPFGQFLSPWASAAVVFFEGLSSGIIITYTAMQYFKKSKPVKIV
ncbi:MAG: hypothetical protein ACJAUV_000077 [Flavobacteriales bacterium]|jgi:hypothetical protein